MNINGTCVQIYDINLKIKKHPLKRAQRNIQNPILIENT